MQWCIHLWTEDGASSAIHESIGDAIMDAAMSPQHLHRLGIITDKELFSNSFDQFLLLKQALTKLPEIPFSLVMDKYRWDIFRGKITGDKLNSAYWKMSERIRGVVAPEQRGEEFFDAAGKFHISDNTPYIRNMMERGASITWSEALKIVVGKGTITTKPLLEYYKPIYRYLENYIKLYKIPVGW
ncbi:angiotensin-converting enzyme [Holotrichia oblita]|uniref:Angiotensin-converting enzyme n=1 Tax=Holotrichia oblita TaxID=644536 RepID=A0ACB9TJM4_HOLOL|nr:angiotensin-converting enzyme [Holotrichia oblita]